MTFDDDYIQLITPHGPLRRQSCKSVGLSWPPPDEIEITDAGKRIALYVLKRRSQITTRSADGWRVCRMAQYVQSTKR